jgi:hypothetical protein
VAVLHQLTGIHAPNFASSNYQCARIKFHFQLTKYFSFWRGTVSRWRIWPDVNTVHMGDSALRLSSPIPDCSVSIEWLPIYMFPVLGSRDFRQNAYALSSSRTSVLGSSFLNPFRPNSFRLALTIIFSQYLGIGLRNVSARYLYRFPCF